MTEWSANCTRGTKLVDPKLSLSEQGLSSSQEVCLLVALIELSDGKAERLPEHPRISNFPLGYGTDLFRSSRSVSGGIHEGMIDCQAM